MKTFKIICLGLLAISVFVLLAGIIKFNVTDMPFVGEPTVYADDAGRSIEVHHKADGSIQVNFMEFKGDHLKAFVAQRASSASGERYESDDTRFVFWSKGDKASIHNQNNEIVFQGINSASSSKEAASDHKETIYFSESTGTWQDHIGICYSCTPENGFSADGAVDNIVWRELQVVLRNDLGENPDTEEVRRLFQEQYAEESGYYPVHIQQKSDMFVIQVAVAKELRGMDFFDSQGALLATYEVIRQ